MYDFVKTVDPFIWRKNIDFVFFFFAFSFIALILFILSKTELIILCATIRVEQRVIEQNRNG